MVLSWNSLRGLRHQTCREDAGCWTPWPADPLPSLFSACLWKVWIIIIFETGIYVAQAGPKLTVWLRMALNSWSPPHNPYKHWESISQMGFWMLAFGLSVSAGSPQALLHFAVSLNRTSPRCLQLVEHLIREINIDPGTKEISLIVLFSIPRLRRWAQ